MTIQTRNIADLAVTAAKLAANAVSAAKLSATMATGFIPLSLAAARAIITNDIGVIAVGGATTVGSGGLLGSDGTGASGVVFKRINGATDKNARVEWQTGSVIPIHWSFTYPSDLDDTATVVVKCLAGMKAGSVDVPTLTVSYFEGVGDTNAGGTTAALSTTVATVSVTVAAADVAAAPQAASVSVLPGAHATGSNDVYLYGAWAEYTRK
jgi:hypothetical protein